MTDDSPISFVPIAPDLSVAGGAVSEISMRQIAAPINHALPDNLLRGGYMMTIDDCSSGKIVKFCVIPLYLC